MSKPKKLSNHLGFIVRLIGGFLLGAIIISYAAWHLLSMGSFFYELLF